MRIRVVRKRSFFAWTVAMAAEFAAGKVGRVL
jgi:acetolactate synthase regulatory subunit